MKTIREFFAQRPSGTIFHYTDATASIGILRNKTVWASSIRHLNDSKEFIRASSALSDALFKQLPKRDRPIHTLARYLGGEPDPLKAPHIDDLFQAIQDPALLFVASFSEAEDRLSQWRAYCAQGDGYSIGFDASSLTKTVGRTRIVKCIYNTTEADDLCDSLIKSWSQRPELDSGYILSSYYDSMMVLAAIKDPGFEEECEWRLVSLQGKPDDFRAGRHGIVPYLKLAYGGADQLRLTSVRVGPNSDQVAATTALRSLLVDAGVPDLDVSSSAIPLRR